MSHCVISSIVDTGAGNALVIACVVHAHYAPCSRNGEPASPTPLHTGPQPSRAAAVAEWRLRTHGQRTLVLHDDSWPREHTDTEDCWCDPELLRDEAQ